MDDQKVEILKKRPVIFRAVRLEFMFPRIGRLKILKALFFLFAIILVVFLLPYFEGGLSQAIGFSPVLVYYQLTFLGLLMICGFGLWSFLLLEFYFLSVSRPVDYLKTNWEEGATTYKLDFGGARRLYYLGAHKKESVNLAKLYSFLGGGRSNFINMLLLRLNINFDDFFKFAVDASGGNIEISSESLIKELAEAARFGKSAEVGAKEFLYVLFKKDKDFQNFLFERKIREKELLGASRWVAFDLEDDRTRNRWWERSALERIPGIGKDLGFGYTFTLDQFSSEVNAKTSYELHFLAHKKEVAAVEEALSKSGQTNVVLVGEPGVGKHTVVEALTGKILEGKVSASIEFKRVVNLDTASLTAASKTKGRLEELLITIMNEATSAGNVILVIDNFPEFTESTYSLGVNLTSLLEPYLSGSAIQVIALSDTDAYNRIIGREGKVARFFDRIDIPEPSLEETVKVLEDISSSLERRFGVLVTYLALQAVAELSDRYISQGVMPEKAVDLFDQVMAHAAGKGKGAILSPEDVEKIVEKDMGIPIAKATGEEAEKLLKLEDILHERVVDQEEAIKAVANSLRRVRSGLHTGRRPIGSFLFLGPTGVGKTETAKALARTYFGSEDTMIRYDMSEFQGADGIEKLIGAFGGSNPGLLAVALRQKPFSLLLFDEFEKSSKDVINLFLQILDEGMFTDTFGKKVSVRDSIVIATSNAGSNMIWDLVKSGKDPASIEKEVVDHIRKQGIFSPEILNRFDAIVVFHPLDREKLRQVARILLNELARTLKDKDDIILEISDELVDKMVEVGYDPVMGARPMRRAIQDRLEQFIAQKMLKGELPRGSTIKLYPGDINKL